MGRSKQSAEECVQNLQRRAVELQQKIGKQTVSEAMRRHPWCVHELLSKLEALGLVAVTESGSRKLVEKSGCHAMPPSLQAQARASRQKQAAPGPSPRKGDEMAPDIAPDDQVPTKYWTLDGLSPHSLASRILSVAEPASLSMPNLKSITVKGQSLQNHQVHVRLVEFMTGLPPDFSLSGVYRSWKALSEFVCERNECRGRRLQGATLPVDFDNMGIYEMIASEGSPTICIRHRFTNQQVDYQRTSLPHHTCIRQLFIDSNWSENRAAISSTADPSRQHDVMLLPRFPIQPIKDPPRLAIEDEPAPSASPAAILKSADTPPPTRKRVVRSPAAPKAAAAKSCATAKKRPLNAGAFLSQLAKRAKHGKMVS